MITGGCRVLLCIFIAGAPFNWAHAYGLFKDWDDGKHKPRANDVRTLNDYFSRPILAELQLKQSLKKKRQEENKGKILTIFPYSVT